ncbi:MAG: GTP 3',8-cyclase MoaA [Saprospiraceae bacterium]|nr:GTP 3',8-cyclase MoaA [Saprospiraceae bacterium]
MLYDNHNRPVNYLRLAVTDRCNLRCFYCMPEEGIQYLPKQELMSYEEMLRIVRMMVGLGIDKLRITGGEPFIRRDMMDFLGEMSRLEGLQQIHITTNGVVTAPLVPELKRLGIRSVNLSLDTLDRRLFHEITRRDDFDKVIQTFEALLTHGITTKINAVMMEGKNDNDLVPLAMLTKDHPVGVRFIEEMPFNGGEAHYDQLWWSHRRILEVLQDQFPGLEKLPDPPSSTSYNYQIPGHRGTVGIIAAYSRTFCGTCNRIRLTPQGMLKTCLYDDGVFNIKNLLRAGASDDQLGAAVLEALGNRAKDGFEAEGRRLFGLRVSESMATIGG